MCLSWLKKLFSKKIPADLIWGPIIVGKVIKVEKHPNADRLKLCTVDCGTETRRIVCGGSNVIEGMLAAVARPGVKVRFGGKAEEMELKETVIRGIKSEGMLCGADEIDLQYRFPAKQEKEIIDLTEFNAHPGTRLSEVLK